MMAYVFLEPAALNEEGNWLALLIALSAKSVLILGLAGLVAFALRRAAAASRHLVWNLALASLLALPLLAVALPAWQWSVFPEGLLSRASSHASSTAAPVEKTAPSAHADAATLSPAAGANDVFAAQPAKRQRHALDPAGSTATAQPSASPSIESHASYGSGAVRGDGLERAIAWALSGWLVGAALIMAHLLVGLGRVWRLARGAEVVTDAEWLRLVARLSRRLALTQAVTLRRSVRVTMPMTCGLFRASVLLPADVNDWSRDRREVVLLHELAHVKRRDCLTQLMAQAACALYWFNPLAWVAARRLRVERERACDDQVLDAGAKASDYADHLLDIARSMGATPNTLMAAVAIARRSQLEGRLLAILDPRLRRRTPNRATVIFIAIAMLALVSPLAMLRPAASAQTKRPRPAVARPPVPAAAPAGAIIASPAIPPAPHVAGAAPQAALAPAEPGAPAELGPPPEPGAPPEPLMAEPALAPPAAWPAPPATMPAPAVAPAVVPAAAPAFAPARAPQAPESPQAPLSQQDKDALVEAFREALKDSDSEMREQALFTLSHISGPRATEAIIGALKDSNPQVREKAAWALGLRRGEGVTAALIAALRDENAGVREKAAWALGLKGNSQAVEPLMEALKDKSADVRATAAWALGLRGDPRAIKALNAASKDEDREVRGKALWALGMLLMRRGEAVTSGEGDNDKDNEIEIDTEGRVRGRVRGGIASGITGGVAGGVAEGIGGGIAGGVASTVRGGVAAGVASGVASGVEGGFVRARGRVERKVNNRPQKAKTKQP